MKKSSKTQKKLKQLFFYLISYLRDYFSYDFVPYCQLNLSLFQF